jgi:hypothetical protein
LVATDAHDFAPFQTPPVEGEMERCFYSFQSLTTIGRLLVRRCAMSTLVALVFMVMVSVVGITTNNLWLVWACIGGLFLFEALEKATRLDW